MKFNQSRFFYLTTGIVLLPLGVSVAPPILAQAAIAPEAGSEVPSGAFLSPPPDFAQWVEAFSYPEERAPTKGLFIETRTRKITIKKTKKIVHEETISAQGETREDWYIGPNQYSKLPSASGWVSGPENVQSAGGFHDLDWIVEGNYIGVVKFGGKSCLVFTLTHSGPLTASVKEQLLTNLDALPTVGYIDADTRLPVQVRQYGIIRNFQFMEAPTEMLTPPPDLAQDLKKAEDLRARFSKPLQSN
jgi:hypothetical protein